MTSLTYQHPDFMAGLKESEEINLKVVWIYRQNGEEIGRTIVIGHIDEWKWNNACNLGEIEWTAVRTMPPEDELTDDDRKLLDSLKTLLIIRELEAN